MLNPKIDVTKLYFDAKDLKIAIEIIEKIECRELVLYGKQWLYFIVYVPVFV